MQRRYISLNRRYPDSPVNIEHSFPLSPPTNQASRNLSLLQQTQSLGRINEPPQDRKTPRGGTGGGLTPLPILHNRTNARVASLAPQKFMERQHLSDKYLEESLKSKFYSQQQQHEPALAIFSPKNALYSILAAKSAANKRKESHDIKRKCAEFFQPHGMLAKPPRQKTSPARDRIGGIMAGGGGGAGELSVLERKEAMQAERWLDMMEIDLQREIEQMLQEEKVANVGELALNVLHRRQELTLKQMKLYHQSAEEASALPRGKLLNRALAGILATQQKWKNLLELRRAKEQQEIGQLKRQIEELRKLRAAELAREQEELKTSRPQSIFSLNQEYKIHEQMKTLIQNCDYSGANLKLREVVSQLQGPKVQELRGSKGTHSWMLGSDVTFGDLKENISNRLLGMQLNTTRILLDKIGLQAVTPVDREVQTDSYEDMEKQAEKLGKLPEFVKREKYEKLKKQYQLFKDVHDQKLADARYKSHIIKQKYEQLLAASSQLENKVADLHNKAMILENSNIGMKEKLKKKAEDWIKQRKQLEERLAKERADILDKLQQTETSLAYYKQIAELHIQKQELEEKKEQDTRVVLQTFHSSPSTDRSLLYSSSPSPRAQSVGQIRVEVTSNPNGSGGRFGVLNQIDSEDEESDISSPQRRMKKKLKQPIMSSQESVDQVVLQSRMKHSDGFRAYHQPGEIRPKDPDALHPLEYQLGQSRSKQELHWNISQPVIRRKIQPAYLQRAKGPVTVVGVQTDDRLVTGYLADMKRSGKLYIEAGVQTGTQIMIGMPAPDEEHKSPNKRQVLHNKFSIALQNSRMGGDSMKSISASVGVTSQVTPVEMEMISDEGESREESCSDIVDISETQQSKDATSPKGKVITSKDWTNFAAKKSSGSGGGGESGSGHGPHCPQNCEHLKRATAQFWKTTKNLSLQPFKKILGI